MVSGITSKLNADQLELYTALILRFSRRLGDGQVLTEDEAMLYNKICNVLRLNSRVEELLLELSIKGMEKIINENNGDSDTM